MASKGSLALRGAGDVQDAPKAGFTSGILLKLDDDVVQSMRKAATTTDGLRFTTGDVPKLRIGNRTIPLNMSGDDFRNELFTSTTGLSSTDFTFTGIISHRAKLTADSKPEPDMAGMDAALQTLQSNMATIRQEKQAKEVGISDSVLYVPKSRVDAARKERQDKKHGRSDSRGASTPASPSLHMSRPSSSGMAPTSAPTTLASMQSQAMKSPLIHLLAMSPAKREELEERTHIPSEDLTGILERVAKQVNGMWQLTDRAYRELDVWKFEYPSQHDRQAAIDNAVKAYDRMRLGTDEQLWQMLLPTKDRGKGIVLSKLHLGGSQVNRSLTPLYQPSPTPLVDGNNDSRVGSTTNTPRHGGSTPRPSSKGDIMKRLLSKDPKKARAAEEAKEKKKKEREAAGSDREGEKPTKRAAGKKTNPNIKSAELVHSSDEESDDAPIVNDTETRVIDKPPLKQKPKQKASAATSSDSSDTPIKSKRNVMNAAAKSKTDKSSSKAPSSSTAKVSIPNKAAEQSTPKKATTNTLSAPSSQQKTKHSPQAPNSRPTAPSPLGAVRPRVASDVSDRGAVGVQRIRQGAATPQGLGISTEPFRKRHDTVTSVDSTTSNGAGEKSPPRIISNGNATRRLPRPINNDSHETKRKAEDSPSQTPASKHRKLDPKASQSSSTATFTSSHNSATLNPNALEPTSTSNSEDSVMESITYNQGVRSAQSFRDHYYPAYSKMYEELEAKEKRGEQIGEDEKERFWAMHRRIETMKKEIYAASRREGEE